LENKKRIQNDDEINSLAAIVEPKDDVGSSRYVLASVLLNNPTRPWNNVPFLPALGSQLGQVPRIRLKHVTYAITAHWHHHLCTTLQHKQHLVRGTANLALSPSAGAATW